MAISLSTISNSWAGLASVVSSDEQAVNPAMNGIPTIMLKISRFVFISFIWLVGLCDDYTAMLGILRSSRDSHYREALLRSCIGIATDADHTIADT